MRASTSWSTFLATLTDEAIDTMVAAFRGCPAPLGAVRLEHLHGAVTRAGVTDTAFPQRHSGTPCCLSRSGSTRSRTRNEWPGRGRSSTR